MNTTLRSPRIGSPTRRRFSPSHIRQCLDDFYRSGLSAVAFCRQHRLCYSAFCRWRKQHRAAPPRPPRLHALPLGSLLAPSWAAEITLADGSTLRLHAHASPAWVNELLRSLRASC